MVRLYGRDFSAREIGRWVGDFSQIAGVKRYELSEGKGKGIGCVDFWTGSGFQFTVLLDRGMDISQAFYRGRSLCWRSPTGDVHPHFYEPEGFGWLRSFFGGLLVTCGLTQVGNPCKDNGETLGLHGRISNIPARNVKIKEEWRGADYFLCVEGEVYQSCVFGEDLVLKRKIWTKMGESRLWVEDEVENRGYRESPLMILYHLNIGFPILSEGSRLLSPTLKVEPIDEKSEKGKENYSLFSAPRPNFREMVYYHKMRADKDGIVRCALVNDNLDGEGLGVYICYNIGQLPHFVEWKMMGEREYVVGMEAANCHVEGRAKERERGTLFMLKPGGVKHFSLEVGIVKGKEQITKFEKRTRLENK